MEHNDGNCAGRNRIRADQSESSDTMAVCDVPSVFSYAGAPAVGRTVDEGPAGSSAGAPPAIAANATDTRRALRRTLRYYHRRNRVARRPARAELRTRRKV